MGRLPFNSKASPIGADLGGLVFLHIASGAMAFFFLMHLSWYPQFMMGDSSGGIQSRLSRLLSEGKILPSECMKWGNVRIVVCPALHRWMRMQYYCALHRE